MRWPRATLAAALTFASPSLSAQTDAAETALRQSVAVVVARGINSADSSPLASQGTGFFINSMGVIVTSFHLKGNLPSTVEPSSISYEVHLDALSPPIPATQLFASPETDVLILYAPVEGKPIGTLKRADRTSARIQLAKTPVYAISYASGYSFSKTPGFITSWTGPINPVFPAWTTNVNYAAGQSGSPVVLDDGRVIAIVKGADTQGGAIGIVVPISFIPSQFWEPGTTLQGGLAALSDGADLARVVVTRTVVTAAPQSFVESVVLTRAPCDPSSKVNMHVAAKYGWSIDPASVTLSQRSFKGRSLRASLENLSAASFDVVADMESAGTCNGVLGQGVAVGDAAVYEAELRYRQSPPVATARRVVVAEAAAISGVQLPVGNSSQHLDFALRSTDGTLRPFTPSKSELLVRGGQAVLDVGRVASARQ